MKPEVRAVVFAYHDMGVMGLDALVRHGFRVQAVFSHEDDPSEKRWFASVRDWCRQAGLECLTPDKINTAPWPERVRQMRPDFIFSFYYRRLLSQAILDTPARGALNLHSSLLPKYRGCAPVNWALINGETQTGVTLHHMVRRADAGDIVAQHAVPIAAEDTAAMLYGRLVAAARQLLDETLPLLLDGTAPRTPQNDNLATCFPRRRPADGEIDWSRDARSICNLIRAVTDPYPGAFTILNGERLIVWEAERVLQHPVRPGELRSIGPDILIGANGGALRLKAVQWKTRRLEGQAIAKALRGYDTSSC